MCFISNDSSSFRCDDDLSGDKYDDIHYATLLIGQTLIGIGAIPMFTVGLTYVDENCKQKMTPFYVGK